MLLFYHAFIFKGRHAVRQRTVPVSARPVQAGTVQRVRHTETATRFHSPLDFTVASESPADESASVSVQLYHLIWHDVAICTFLRGATQQVWKATHHLVRRQHVFSDFWGLQTDTSRGGGKRYRTERRICNMLKSKMCSSTKALWAYCVQFFTQCRVDWKSC